MTKGGPFTAATREDILQVFRKIDEGLKNQRRTLSVTTIGGISIILQGLRDRSTMDIDIASSVDAPMFQKVCRDRGVPVDIVTVVSTVDIAHASKVVVFQGKALTVESILPEDLIRLKLERFRKQDPEDIYAIIGKIQLSYARFKAIVGDMLPDYVGNPRELLLSAMIVVEELYPQHRDDFEKRVLRKH